MNATSQLMYLANVIQMLFKQLVWNNNNNKKAMKIKKQSIPVHPKMRKQKDCKDVYDTSLLVLGVEHD